MRILHLLLLCLLGAAFNLNASEISRGEFLNNVVVAADIQLELQDKSGFIDVPYEHQYYPAIQAAKDLGIVSGYDDRPGYFGPEDPLTRREASKILLNAFGIGGVSNCYSQPFPDVPTSDWGCKYIQKVKSLGALGGLFEKHKDVYFYPDNNLSHEAAQAMVLVMEAYLEGIHHPFGYIWDSAQGRLTGGYKTAVSIGRMYEQVEVSTPASINYVVTGDKTVTSGQSVTYRIYDSCDGCSYYWEVTGGSFTKLNNEHSQVQFNAPSTGINTETVYLYVFVSDGLGSTSKKKIALTIEPDIDAVANVEFSSSYSQSEDKFYINYQTASNVKFLQLEYAYDNTSWQSIYAANVNGGISSVRDFTIAQSLSNNQIYFRAGTKTSTNPSLSFTASKSFSYTPRSTAGDKSSEWPVAPYLSSMSGIHVSDSITVSWRKVLDSYNKDNANHYELMVADNYRFDNETIYQAPNTATGSNLYEYIKYTVNGLQDTATYYFKVRAVNNLGAGEWSQIQSAQIDYQNLPVFNSYIKPAALATDVAKLPEFCWSADDADGDTLEYRVLWGESSDNLNHSSSFFSGTECYDLANNGEQVLPPNTTIYWRVEMREDGYYKDYYGGSYISSNIHSFTTVNSGVDLAITSATLKTEIKFDDYATFDLVVTNNGGETVNGEWINAFYVKDGIESEFLSGSVRTPDNLAPGQSVILPITIKFRDNLWTSTTGKVYDNVLIAGDSIVRFKNKYVSEQDLNPANNILDVGIHYEDSNGPNIEYFRLEGDGLIHETGEVYSRQGGEMRIVAEVRDDIRVATAKLEYKLLSTDTQWTLIESFAAGTEVLNFRYNDQGQQVSTTSNAYDWPIPADMVLTNEARIRLSTTDDQGNASEKISAPFTIASNHLNVTVGQLPKSSYKVGESITFSVNVDSHYSVSYYGVELDDGRRTWDLVDVTAGTMPTSFTVQLPDDNAAVSNSATLKVFVETAYGNFINVYSAPFAVTANTDLPQPFGNAVQLFSPPTKPDGTSYYNSNINIAFNAIDENGVAHIVAKLTESYYNSSNRYIDNGKYYYVTYNPISGKKSAEIAIPQNYNVVDFALTDEGIPYVLLENRHQLAYASIQNGTLSSIQYLINGDSTTATYTQTGSFSFYNPYIVGNRLYELRSIRNDIDYYDFNNGVVGSKHTIYLSGNNSSFLEADYQPLIANIGSTIYFVDSGESKLVKVDTSAATLETFVLPYQYSESTDNPRYIPKINLAVLNNELYLVMRGEIFKLVGSALAKMADMAHEHGGRIANYNEHWNDVDYIYTVSKGDKLSFLLDTEWSLGLPYSNSISVLDYTPSTNTFSQGVFRPRRYSKAYPMGSSISTGNGTVSDYFELADGKLMSVYFYEFQSSGIDHKNIGLSLFDAYTGDTIYLGGFAGGLYGPFAYSDVPTLQHSNGVPYAMVGGKVYRINMSAATTSRKYYDSAKFNAHNGQLYVTYSYNVDYDGQDANVFESNRDRAKIELPPLALKRATRIHPTKSSEVALSNTIKTGTFYDLEVFGDQIYASTDRFYSINSDFSINDTPTCELGQDMGSIKLTVESQLYLAVVVKQVNGKGFFTLLNKDCSVNREIEVEFGGSSIWNNGELEGLLTDDMFLMFAYDYPTTYVFKYDIAASQLSTVLLPKRTSNIKQSVTVNNHLESAFTWSEGGVPFITFADFSGDIVAPAVTLIADVPTISAGQKVVLSWQASDNQNQLLKYDFYVSKNEGSQTLLQSFTDTSVTNYTYTVPNDSSLNKLTFKLVATDSSNNWGMAQKEIVVEQPISITSFTSDQQSYQRGEKITLNWSIDGSNVADNIQLYGRSGTDDWTLLAENLVTGSYQIDTDTLTGTYDFKLTVRDQSEVLNPQIEITGTWLNFDYQQFTPVTTAYVNTSAPVFNLSWGADITDADQWIAEVFVKTDSETEFSSIATGKYRSFEWEPIASPASFSWYVVVNLDGVEFKSAEQSVSVAQLSPVENLSLSLLNNTSATPQVLVSYSAPANGAQVLIQRSLNFADFVTLATIDSNAYIDSNVGYGDIVSYRAIAIIGENHAAYSQSQDLVINAKLPTGIEFTSADFASGAVVSYKPIDTDTVFESYQIRLGLAEQDEALWSTVAETTGKQVTIPALESGKIYTLRVYAKTPLGDRLNSVTAEKTFATAYSYINLSIQPVVSIDSAVSDSIKLSWTAVDGGESYRVYRNASSNWELVEDTTGLSFSDFNVITASSYQYKVQVLNPISSVESAPTEWVLVDGDFDGDGIGDATDPDDDNDGVADASDAFPLDSNEYIDTDGDGIGNNADTDDDGDGYVDANDAFPLDAAEYVDTDGDGIGNNADTDDDGDGVADASDAFPLDDTEVADTDGDGVGDNSDAFPQDATEVADTDGDGVGDNADVYPDDATRNGVEWAFGYWGTIGNDTADKVKVDNFGNIYAIGRTDAAEDSAQPLLLFKYNEKLELKWIKDFDIAGYSGTDSSVTDIAIDSYNNIYIVGRTKDGGIGDNNAFLIKLDSDRNEIWSHVFGTEKFDTAVDVHIDDGFIYVLGATNGDIEGKGVEIDSTSFVTKFDEYGTRYWTRVVDDNANQTHNALATDSSGSLYVSGHVSFQVAGNTTPNLDVILTKYNSLGEIQWMETIGSEARETSRSLVIDHQDNIYIVGQIAVDANSDTVLYKLDTEGTKLWTKILATERAEAAIDVVIDNAGNVYLTGHSNGDFPNNPSSGGYDVFLTKYNSEGDQMWLSRFGGSANDLAFGVALDIKGDPIISGYTYGTIDGSINYGGSDIFLAKFNASEFPTDSDDDGFSDDYDSFPNDSTEHKDSDNDGIGNNADTDDDNDGIPDTTEIAAGLNPLDASDAALDLDGDGVSNLDESNAGTNINNVDTDGDTYNDLVDEAPLDVNAWDLTAPVITLNGDFIVNIDQGSDYTDSGAVATDNFDGDISASIVVSGSVDTNIPGVYTLSFDVSDAAGNAALVQMRTIIVNEVIQGGDLPVVTPPSDITVAAIDANGTTATVSTIRSFLNGAQARDASGGILFGVSNNAPNIFPLGVTTVTFSATDSAGLTGTAQAKVTIADMTAPLLSLVGLPSVTITVGDNYLDPGANASDNVDGNITVNIAVTGSVNVNAVGTYALTYNVSDSAGNAANSVTRTVTVESAQIGSAPVVSAPADITVAAIDSSGTSATSWSIKRFLNNAAASDAEDGIMWTVNNNAPSIFPLGVTTVTFSATDSHGNVGTDTATVTVTDQTKPVIALQGSSTVTLNHGDDYVDAGATASDNIDGDISSNIVKTGSVNINTSGTYTLAYNVSDNAGNEASAVYRYVTVLAAGDTTPPVVTPPANITVAATDANGTAATAQAIKSFLSGAYASDNTDGILFAVEHDAPTVFGLGVNTVTFSAIDAAGNTGTAQATVTVNDVTAPVITLLGSNALTVELGDNYTEQGATATDNVDGDVTTSIVMTGSVDTNNKGNYSLSYNVADAAGNNAAQVTRIITVQDSNGPVVIPHADITVAANDANGTPATDVAISTFLSAATAYDLADGVITEISHDAPAIFPLGATTVTSQAADSLGNVGTAQATVTVVDLTKPVVTLNGETSVYLKIGESYVEAGVSAFDNVDGDLSNDVVINNGVSTQVAGLSNLIYRVIADNAGNGSRFEHRSISVQPQQAPVITAPSSIVLEATGDYGISSSEAQVVDWLAASAANDVEDGPLSVTNDAPSLLPMGMTKVTFSATDSDGNSGYLQAAVYVEDTTASTIALQGTHSMTVLQGSAFTDPGFTATDAVDGDLSSQVVVNGNVDTSRVGIYNLTYTVTDTNGNRSLPILRSVSVQTADSPTVTLPANIEVAATSTGGISSTDSTITDFLSGASAVDANNQPLSVTHNAPSQLAKGVTLVTFSAIDSSGRKGYAQAVVTVK